jgi:hypothetical protein
MIPKTLPLNPKSYILYFRSVDGAMPTEGTCEERGAALPAVTRALPSRRRLVYLPPGAPHTLNLQLYTQHSRL